MSIEKGASRVVDQCLRIREGEDVVLLDDGNDPELLEALGNKVEETAGALTELFYEEPDHHGEEPPDDVADRMKTSDVFIAPTRKSISHTDARRNACKAGARGVTMPGINREIWNTSLQADYYRVRDISNRAFDLLPEKGIITIRTPSGTDLSIKMEKEFVHRDTGLIHEPGDFGNLPAGEADGGILNAKGKLVVDHFPYAPAGTEIQIDGGKAVDVRHPGDREESELSRAFKQVDGADVTAEFGIGTNPEATLIGNILQDEKVLGTVHVAFGDNTSYFPEGHPAQVKSDIHWDVVCESPTVHANDIALLKEGDPIFR